MLTRLKSLEFKKALDSDTNGELLDVRTQEELNIYGIIGDDQIHIDINRADAAQKILDLDKDTNYYIYCWHGNRSRQIGEFMIQNGFGKVYDLIGGIDEWKKNT